MTIAALLRKGALREIATAIPAIPAIPSKQEATASAVIAGKLTSRAADPGFASSRWRVFFPDGTSIEVEYAPPASREEAACWYPGAIAAEPYTPILEKPLVPMSMSDESIIRDWARRIGENDPEAIAGLLVLCREDANSLEQILALAQRACRTCRHNRRPGLVESPGYCVERADLEIVYGHLRKAPVDEGASCGSWTQR